MGELAGKLEEVGYLLLFVYSLGGGFIGLATAAVFASIGKMSIWVVVLLAAIANFLGSSALYFFGMEYKHTAMESLRKHRRKLALAHLLMKQKGSYVIFIQKFIYGLKTIIPLAAGIIRYNKSKFLWLNAFASIVWACTVGASAYYAGEVIISIIGSANEYPFVPPIAALAIFSILYFYITKLSKRR